MDELPDLQTDADVDALMGRLRARLLPLPAPSPTPIRRDAAARSEAAVTADEGVMAQLVAAQEGLATAVLRTLAAIADTRAARDADAAAPAATPAPAPAGRVPGRRRIAAPAARRPGARARHRR